MNFYWITFEDGQEGTCAAADEALARSKAEVETGKTIKDVKNLPYPGKPYIGGCNVPAFCYTPKECAGNTACPKRLSCVE